MLTHVDVASLMLCLLPGFEFVKLTPAHLRDRGLVRDREECFSQQLIAPADPLLLACLEFVKPTPDC